MLDHYNENLVLAFGTVEHIYIPEHNSVAIISICVPRKEGTRSENCEVVCFRRQKEFVYSLSEGDAVAVAGSIRTRQAIDSGERNRQNIICKDIAKVERFDDEIMA